MKKTRIDYLAIDNSLVKRCSYVRPVKFALSKRGAWDLVPLDQKFPNVYTPLQQVQYSCNKIGTSLFGPSDTDFNLRDPCLYQSRFTIEYNPLYDPALGTYFQRRPVRKILREEHLINEKDDAICSRRYFIHYLRYLESQRSERILKALTREHTERLNDHLREVNESKRNARRMPNEEVLSLRRMKIREAQRKRRLKIKERQLKIAKSTERVEKMKADKSEAIRKRLDNARVDVELRRLKIRQLDAARTEEMKTFISVKLELAAQQRKLLELKAINARMQKTAEIETKQYIQREESRIASAYLVHCREKEMLENISARLNRIGEANAALNRRMEKLEVNSIKRAYEKRTAARITQEFKAQIRSALKMIKKKWDPVKDEEIIQRYSRLTNENVAKCVDLAFEILTDLDAPYSTFDIIHISAGLLHRIAIRVPGFEMPSGAIDKRFIHEMTAETLNAIKENILDMIQLAWDEQSAQRTKKIQQDDERVNELDTCIDAGSPNTICEPAYSDYMMGLRGLVGRPPTPILSLHELVRQEMTDLFYSIDNDQLPYSPAMEIRELMHLQDFQKCILTKNVAFLGRCVRLEVEQHLDRCQATQLTDRIIAQREKLIAEISECMLSFPLDGKKLTRAIRQISKVISVEIHDSVKFAYNLLNSCLP